MALSRIFFRELQKWLFVLFITQIKRMITWIFPLEYLAARSVGLMNQAPTIEGRSLMGGVLGEKLFSLLERVHKMIEKGIGQR